MMEQTIETTETKLVKTHLRLAQDALNANNLAEAENFFKKALEVGGEHPDPAPQIYQILKDYSDRITKHDSPNWDLAHQALNMLNDLNLQNEETLAWQRELKLHEAESCLDSEELDKGFGIFKDLILNATELEVQEKLRVDISRRVCAHLVQRLPERRWLSLREVSERLKPFRPSADERYDWPETISQILNAASGQGQHIPQLTHELKRYRNLTYTLAIGIVIALAVAFVLVIFVPSL